MKKIIFLLSLFFSLSFYGQNDTIPVVKTSKISVVSADNFNVVYRGLPNPISIAVPNCKSFTVIGNGLQKFPDGRYQLNPGPGLEAIITIDIVLNDGSTKKEEHKFRIKNIPYLRGKINGLSCDQCIIEMTKEELNKAIISLDTGLSLYGLEIKDQVDSFQVEFSEKVKFTIFSNQFDEKTLEIINKLKAGSIFTINYIHWPNPLNVCRAGAGPIKVMIVKREKISEE